MSNEYRIGSNGLCYTPGIYRWTQAMPSYKERLNFWHKAMPDSPGWVLKALAVEKGPVTVDGDVLVIRDDDISDKLPKWPNSYRCRACGSERVQAAVWTNLNSPDDDDGTDFFLEDIEEPDGRGVYCEECQAEKSGVYLPYEGPESGRYPADE